MGPSICGYARSTDLKARVMELPILFLSVKILIMFSKCCVLIITAGVTKNRFKVGINFTEHHHHVKG